MNKKWQWLEMPEIRSKARVAGFAITNPKAIAPSRFVKLDLKRGPDGQVVTGGMLAGGVYKK